MALLDEEKLQGHVYEILQMLRKQAACCKKVSSTNYGHSSVTGGDVFILIFEDGTLEVRDLGANGAVLTPAGYGALTRT
jgi:hypothetical protein